MPRPLVPRMEYVRQQSASREFTPADDAPSLARCAHPHARNARIMHPNDTFVERCDCASRCRFGMPHAALSGVKRLKLDELPALALALNSQALPWNMTFMYSEALVRGKRSSSHLTFGLQFKNGSASAPVGQPHRHAAAADPCSGRRSPPRGSAFLACESFSTVLTPG